MTPQARAIARLKEQGCIVATVEQTIRTGKMTFKRDLFGGFDLLAVDPDGQTIAVQVTSRSNVAARVSKIAALETVPALRKANWRLLVWGYGKTKTRGEWVEVDVS